MADAESMVAALEGFDMEDLEKSVLDTSNTVEKVPPPPASDAQAEFVFVFAII